MKRRISHIGINDKCLFTHLRKVDCKVCRVNGFTILEMKEEEQSLEEVFLELTAGPEASDDETEDDSKNDSKDDSEESVHTEKGDEK